MKEIKNVLKEKNESLTRMEWMAFFFVPFNSGPRQLDGKHFIHKKEENFKELGLDRKMKQSATARVLGIIFYIIILGIIFKIYY